MKSRFNYWFLKKKNAFNIPLLMQLNIKQCKYNMKLYSY